jgi:hypothetical protein
MRMVQQPYLKKTAIFGGYIENSKYLGIFYPRVVWGLLVLEVP